jgi:hypothetical protein
MTAIELMRAVEKAGGALEVKGDQIKYTIPKRDIWLVRELKQNREELIELLTGRRIPPLMPPGVRLVKWEPKDPPIAIVRLGVVTEVHKFIGATLRELRARLEGKNFLAGNWSLRELVDRLEQVGVQVQVGHDEHGNPAGAVTHE